MNLINDYAILSGVKERSDRLMNYFLIGYFLIGCGFAFFYRTWPILIGIGGICVLAYYSAKYLYQNWKLQVPILVVLMLHLVVFDMQHPAFSGLHAAQPTYFNLSAFIMHIGLAVAIFLTCGVWSYQLKQDNELYLQQALHTIELEKEALISAERLTHKTELKALNEMIAQKAKELAVSKADLEQFVCAASHNLQEPLRMVTGFLGQINKKYGDGFDEKGKQYMYFAVDGATRMRQMTLDLLDYSRVGHTDDKRERVDLQELVLGITGSFRKQAEELNAIINIDQLPVLNTFRGPARQVFQNLIGNALKYHNAGSAPNINISAEDKGDHWKFAVTDNGIGINSAHLKEIFLPFKCLHSREEYAGTGMGLAITKKIVENLCGNITVDSLEGGGSKFYFTLPKAS